MMTSTGLLSDATKSVSRAYINNFQDKGKQTAIDMFLVSIVQSEVLTLVEFPMHRAT